jgi:hypothetical protein
MVMDDESQDGTGTEIPRPTEETPAGPAADDTAAEGPDAATTSPDDVEPSPAKMGTATAGRLFGGVDFSGDMRDRKDGTWLAVVELDGEGLRVVRLEATGRIGLENRLMDADASLLRVEALGLDFPFSLPLPFVKDLLGQKRAGTDWWAVARRFKSLSRPAYLKAVNQFREAHGEVKRHTDEIAGAFSPLHRVNPDLGPMVYHGIRMIAKGRSRHALRPFESARGRLLFEVYPGGFIRRHRLDAERVPGGRLAAIVTALGRLPRYPLEIGSPWRSRCLSQRDALDAVLAARCAAGAVLSGESEKDPKELAPGQEDRIRAEGWIYGLDL